MSRCGLNITPGTFDLCSVQKTLELRPEVVLLDLALPGLNGIEAAERILKYAPDNNRNHQPFRGDTVCKRDAGLWQRLSVAAIEP